MSNNSCTNIRFLSLIHQPVHYLFRELHIEDPFPSKDFLLPVIVDRYASIVNCFFSFFNYYLEMYLPILTLLLYISYLVRMIIILKGN